eukprot:m.124012 g.124012  ORF g.124012 m.124012 type:complete len:350 (-) comp16611_c0_seq2:170-1219(-)
MAPVTVCLVGLGRAGTFHMQSLDALGNKKARLCYAVDCDEERAKAVAERYNCTALTSLDKALEDPDLQAVIVASTTHAHFDQVVAALKAKKAVLTEKPISHDHTKLKFAIELALEQRVPFLVGFQRRFDESFRSLRKQLQQGSVGSPRIVKATSRDNPLPPIEYLKISGGLFHDMLCHDFDMIHFLTGQVPVSVYTVGHAYEDAVREMDDIDTCLVTMSFESGLVASVDCSRISSYGYDQRIEVFGDQGMLEVHNHRADTVRLSTASGHTDAVADHSFPQRYAQAYRSELAEFLDMVAENRLVPDEDTQRHVVLERVATAAELSWQRKRPVTLAELDEERAAKVALACA